MRNITVGFLEEIFRRVVDKVKFEVQKDIKIEMDFYLNIPTSEWSSYNHSVIPQSLYDDIDSLKLLTEDKERICTYVDFDRLAGLLKAISLIQNPAEGVRSEGAD